MRVAATALDAAPQSRSRQHRAIDALLVAAPVSVFRTSGLTECVEFHEQSGGLGLPASDPPGHIGENWMALVHAQDLPLLLQETQAFVADRTAVRHPSREFRLQFSDGSTHWFQVHLAKIFDDNGEFHGLVGALSDISRLKCAEQELQQANAELARATRMKDRFLAHMSHELRTPLSAVLGMTESLLQGVYGSINDDQRQGLEIIAQSGTHLLALTNDVLDLARIESGNIELDLQPIDVRDLCETSLSLVAQQAHRRGIRIDIEYPSLMPAFAGDERRLRQVLVNLLGNAVKFTRSGGAVTLGVSAQGEPAEEPAQIRFVVADTGVGFEPVELDSLFEPFVRGGGALEAHTEGTGLGLALVKQLVALHGGTVTAVSEPGNGSRFSVDLPVRPASFGSPSRAGEPNEQITTDPSSNLTTARVLLVEDNDLVAATTERFLLAAHFEVLRAADGSAALDIGASQAPDVVLMDIQLPGMDGLETIRRMRANPAMQRLPIIALTGLTMQGDEQRCLAAGADAYLCKPYPMQALVEAIHSLLAR